MLTSRCCRRQHQRQMGKFGSTALREIEPMKTQKTILAELATELTDFSTSLTREIFARICACTQMTYMQFVL